MRVEQHAATVRRVRGERTLRARAIAEAAVLDEHGLRALQQIARELVRGPLPPDRYERARPCAAVERHARDAVVLIARSDDDEERRVRRAPDRPCVRHRVLPIRGWITLRDAPDKVPALESSEVPGEVRIVEHAEAVDREPVERGAEARDDERRVVDGGVHPGEPVRMHDALCVVVAQLWLRI